MVPRPLHILGIETSCDETAAAVVRRDADGTGHILSNVVLSQLAEHAPYGGVVPEIAARAHLERLQPLVGQTLSDAGIAPEIWMLWAGGAKTCSSSSTSTSLQRLSPLSSE